MTLKKCPLCRDEGRVEISVATACDTNCSIIEYRVACSNWLCGRHTSKFKSRELAEEAWNNYIFEKE